jgi:hypothetical protein
MLLSVLIVMILVRVMVRAHSHPGLLHHNHGHVLYLHLLSSCRYFDLLYVFLRCTACKIVVCTRFRRWEHQPLWKHHLPQCSLLTHASSTVTDQNGRQHGATEALSRPCDYSLLISRLSTEALEARDYSTFPTHILLSCRSTA